MGGAGGLGVPPHALRCALSVNMHTSYREKRERRQATASSPLERRAPPAQRARHDATLWFDCDDAPDSFKLQPENLRTIHLKAQADWLPLLERQVRARAAVAFPLHGRPMLIPHDRLAVVERSFRQDGAVARAHGDADRAGARGDGVDAELASGWRGLQPERHGPEVNARLPGPTGV